MFSRLLTIWVAALITVLPLLYLLSPWMDCWSIEVRAVVISGVMVPTMQLLTVPLMMRLTKIFSNLKARKETK